MQSKKTSLSYGIDLLINGLVDPSAFSVGNKTIDAIRTQAKKAIISSETSELIDIFGSAHHDFLSNIKHLTFADSISVISDQIPEKHIETLAGKKVIGKITISSDGYRYWTLPEVQEQGIILCDLLRAFKDHSTKILSVFESKGINRGTFLSKIVLSQARLGTFLYIPDNVYLDGVFIFELDVNPPANSLNLVHLVTMMGNSSSGNLIINIGSEMKEEGQSVFAIQNETIVGDNSRLNIIQNQKAGNQTALFISGRIEEGKNSVVNDFVLDSGSELLDRYITVDAEGEGSEAQITALYYPKNKQRFYYDTHQKHHASHTVSDLLFKGVLRENSYSLWKGNILVANDTVGADGYQVNNILLMADSAKAVSIPGLEILTDDVKCSHGVTMGNIDKNQMFYLQSRGINNQDAEKLIVDGFMLSAIKRIKDTDFENFIQNVLEN